MTIIDKIRHRYHPLYRLRSSSIWRWLQHSFDIDVSIKVPDVAGSGQMFIRALRDASWILPHSAKENHSRSLFREIIIKQKAELFFDIGANVGIYTWEFLSHCSLGKALLFEADFTNIQLLRKSIASDKSRQQVFLVPFAVSDKIEIAQFYIDTASGATGSLNTYASNESNLHATYGVNQTQAVLTTYLDQYKEFAKGSQSFIKIDVEGAELQVLKGGINFIIQNQPLLLIETDNPACWKLMYSLDYEAFDLGENSNVLFCPAEFVNKEIAFLKTLGLSSCDNR